jgi:hypothetical protein
MCKECGNCAEEHVGTSLDDAIDAWDNIGFKIEQ